MLRLLVTPKWIAWHLLTLGAMAACGFLSLWQWHRAGSAMGSALNVGYGVQWPIFAVFFAFLWWRFLRMELRTVRAPVDDDGVDEVPAPRAAGPAEVDAETPDRETAAPEPATGDRSSPFTPRPAGVEPSRLSDPQIRAYNDALAELAARDRET